MSPRLPSHFLKRRLSQLLAGAVVALPGIPAFADAVISVQGASAQASFKPTSLPFVIQRSGDSAFAVTVSYETQDGTAVAGRDYQATAGTVTLAAGQTSATVNVPLLRKLPRNGGSKSFSLVLDSAAPVASSDAPVFVNAALVTIDPFSSAAAVADFNGDGKIDAVLASLSTGLISVLRNDTPASSAVGNFSVAASIAPLISGPGKIGVADLNRDGKPDIVVTSVDTNRMTVLMNTTPAGASAFSFVASLFQLPDYGYVNDVSFADFNADGIVDLALSNPGSTAQRGTDRVLVYTNTTPVGVTAPVFTLAAPLPSGPNGTGIGASGVRTLDVNGDGKPDIAVSGFAGAAVAVALNTTPAGASTPTFTSVTSFGVAEPVTSLVTADLNGDGKPDLVTANGGFSQLGSTWSTLVNTTAKGATKPSFMVTDVTGGGPVTAAIADLNGDGRPDVLIADALLDSNGGGGIVSYLNTTPTGATAPVFTKTGTYACCDEPRALAVGDFNRDGRPDLITNDSVGSLADIAFLAAPVTNPKAVISTGTATGTIVLPTKP